MEPTNLPCRAAAQQDFYPSIAPRPKNANYVGTYLISRRNISSILMSHPIIPLLNINPERISLPFQ